MNSSSFLHEIEISTIILILRLHVNFNTMEQEFKLIIKREGLK